MKGVNATGMSSLPSRPKWESQVVRQVVPPLTSSRKGSLHVSIQKRIVGTPAPPFIQPAKEKRLRRLASLGEQVGRLAHDIRNPLSSIEWLATLLGRDHHSPQERQELSEQCIQAVRSLEHLVSNLLVFAAPLQARQESVCLLSLLDDVELLMMFLLKKKRITIYRHIEGTPSMVDGHESLLKQVLLNLLSNAIHASEPDSSIEIHYSCESRLFEKKRGQFSTEGIAVRIRDYGCGMAKEELEHIGRPFYSKRKGGTGLGLSIVKHIVHIHRGLIDITSQLGKGTTVELFFPQ